MNSRRLNVRFNLDNLDEKNANDFLEALSQNSKHSRNKFIVEAVIEKIRFQNNPRDFTLEDIRAVIREELQDVSFVSSAQPTAQKLDTELTEEEKLKNNAEAVSFLENFMWAKTLLFGSQQKKAKKYEPLWLIDIKSKGYISRAPLSAVKEDRRSV